MYQERPIDFNVIDYEMFIGMVSDSDLQLIFKKSTTYWILLYAKEECSPLSEKTIKFFLPFLIIYLRRDRWFLLLFWKRDLCFPKVYFMLTCNQSIIIFKWTNKYFNNLSVLIANMVNMDIRDPLCSKEVNVAPQEIWPLPSTSRGWFLFACWPWTNQIVMIWFKLRAGCTLGWGRPSQKAQQCDLRVARSVT